MSVREASGHTVELTDTVPQPRSCPSQCDGAGDEALARCLIRAGAILWWWSQGLVCTRIICCHGQAWGWAQHHSLPQ